MGNSNYVYIGGNANDSVIQSENTVKVTKTEQKKPKGLFLRLIAMLKEFFRQ